MITCTQCWTDRLQKRCFTCVEGDNTPQGCVNEWVLTFYLPLQTKHWTWTWTEGQETFFGVLLWAGSCQDMFTLHSSCPCLASWVPHIITPHLTRHEEKLDLYVSNPMEGAFKRCATRSGILFNYHFETDNFTFINLKEMSELCWIYKQLDWQFISPLRPNCPLMKPHSNSL